MSSRRKYVPDANNISTKKVGTLVFDASNHVLLILQKNGIWSLPKGSQKVGEDDMTTALRETKEESGLDLGEYKPVDEMETSLHDSTYKFYIYRLPVNHTELHYDEAPINSKQMRWQPIAEYKSLGKINQLTKGILQEYASKGGRGGTRKRTRKGGRKGTHRRK